MDEKEIYKALAAPFPLDDIEWRVQIAGKEKNKPGDKAMMLPYVTARAVADRLSSVLGIGHWRTSNRFESGGGGRDDKGGWICKIEALIGDTWVWHEDGSPATDIEAFKGGMSKALVRCAVRFGVGAYLYDFPFQWCTLEGSGQKGFAPRNWKPDISKIPADCRPAKGGGRPATEAPVARVVDPEPPEDPKPQSKTPVGDAVPVAKVAGDIKQGWDDRMKQHSGPAMAAYEKIKALVKEFPPPFDLAKMVNSQDPKKREPYVMYAEAALRTDSERAKSGHWSKMRWILDKWPVDKGDNVKQTDLYKDMLLIEHWAKLVHDSCNVDPLDDDYGSQGVEP